MTASKIVIDMTLLLPPELMAAIGPGRPRECTGGQGQSSGRAIAVHHLMGDLATLGKKPADEQLGVLRARMIGPLIVVKAPVVAAG